MRWTAAHLSWFVWMLLALWAPPVCYAIAIDLRLIAAPGTGYPGLNDPALVISAVQLTLMAAALPGMASRNPRSWNLLAAALLFWLAHVAWVSIARMRLDGARGLRSSETATALGCALAAAVVLLGVRRYFAREHAAAEGFLPQP